MRLASSLVGLSLSVGLCAAAHAQTAPASPPGGAYPASVYEEQAVGVRNLDCGDRESARSGDRPECSYAYRKWDAFRGPDHHPIDEESFFRIVGREDLLRRYHREAIVKRSATIGGGTLVFGGLVFAAIATALRSPGGQPAVGCEGTGCSGANSRDPSPVWGLAIAGAGAVSLIVGHLLDPTPIDAEQADRLARSYDESLRARLGQLETASSR